MPFRNDVPEWNSYHDGDYYMVSVPTGFWDEFNGLARRGAKEDPKFIINQMAEIIPCTPTTNWSSDYLQIDLIDTVKKIREKVNAGQISVLMDCIAVLIDAGDLIVDEVNEFLEFHKIGYSCYKDAFSNKTHWKVKNEQSLVSKTSATLKRTKSVSIRHPEDENSGIHSHTLENRSEKVNLIDEKIVANKRKFSIFISSTYEDLKEERQALFSVALESDFIPVGMEQFHAAPASQWEIITKMIDECDFYLLIIGGRYGSIDEEAKKSYTEKEYDYAKKVGIPVLVLIKKADSITEDKTDSDAEKFIKMQLLDAFRDRVKKEKNTVDFFGGVDELKYIASQTLKKAVEYADDKSGWIRYKDILDIIVLPHEK